MSNHRAARLLILSLTVASCAGESPLGSAPEEEAEASGPAAPTLTTQVITFVDRDSGRAGESFHVWCLLKQGTEFLRPDKAVVSVEPEPAETDAYAHGTHFVATVAGPYMVACAAPGFGADREGVRVSVAAGPAVSWDVAMTERGCYAAHDRLIIDTTVYDAYGNTAFDAPVRAVVEPSTGVAGSLTHGFRFLADGNYQITVDVDEQGPGSTITPVQTTARVDATAPAITMDSPDRGAMVESGNSQVAVRGNVSDSQSDIVELVVAGQPVPISGTSRYERFSVSAATGVGLSVITARAKDACGNVGYVARSMLRSPDYFAPATAAYAGNRIPGALMAQLSQTFVDDGDRSDVDDLATLAERVIGSFDFDAMVAPGALLAEKKPRDCNGCPFGPVFMSVGVEAWRHPSSGRHVHLMPPQILHLEMVAGGVRFAARFDDFDFPLRARVKVRECNLGCDHDHNIEVSGWVGLDRLEVTGVIGANLATGEVDASLTNAEFHIQGAYLDMDCGWMDWACDEVTDFLIDKASDALEEAAADAITEMVPPLLEETLASVELVHEVELPAPASGTLGVSAALDQLGFCGASAGLPVPAVCTSANTNPGSVVAGVAAQVFPAERGASIPASALGPIALGGSRPGFSSQSSFAAAARLDLLNQLLWSAWYSGTLYLPDLSELLGPETGVVGSVELGLPPVLLPGENGNLLELGLGDVQVDAVVDIASLLEAEEPALVTINMTVAAVIGAAAELDTAKGSVWLIPDPEPEVFFEIHQINDAGYSELLGEALGALLARELPVLMRDALAELPLPTFEVGTLPGVAEGTEWYLEDADLRFRDGNVTFRGTVGAREP